MNREHVLSAAALVAAGAFALSACGGPAASSTVDNQPAPAAAAPRADAELPDDVSFVAGTARANGAAQGTGDWATGADGSANSAPAETSRKWVQLRASRAGELDPVVVNGAGLTLYRFDKDTASPSKSNCAGDCAKTWPPVTVAKGAKVFVAGVPKSAVGFVTRDDGSRQVTIKGWPVYRFAKDTKAGDTLGQGVGGTWFGVTPDGEKAGGPAQEPAPAPDSGRKATSVVLFDEPRFSENGAAEGTAGPGCKNLARPRTASSLSALGSLKLWSEKDCKGKSVVVDGDVPDLAKVQFDNLATSVFFG
ncbi:hypothetical protein V5P93_006345 [Actinokineospora auranticolor]|uniref:Putative lipoprotein with Yx(FWY)xxD motif n=1 Tax=Actinokineospora auranticolor TaxID=155976 RepID=A0A2S6GFY8_9PSEU|nr:hypothetical protein [Actinokineospora auranticolor]PPK64091.1 putative lipoprotein with Yx(FWY)xxD motif [Actinokineospora auranticolor]